LGVINSITILYDVHQRTVPFALILENVAFVLQFLLNQLVIRLNNFFFAMISNLKYPNYVANCRCFLGGKYLLTNSNWDIGCIDSPALKLK